MVQQTAADLNCTRECNDAAEWKKESGEPIPVIVKIAVESMRNHPIGTPQSSIKYGERLTPKKSGAI